MVVVVVGGGGGGERQQRRVPLDDGDVDDGDSRHLS